MSQMDLGAGSAGPENDSQNLGAGGIGGDVGSAAGAGAAGPGNDSQNLGAGGVGTAGWKNALPPSWQAHFQNVGSEEEALKIFQRGQNYMPPASAEEIRLTYPKDLDGKISADLEKNFREMCVKEGITGKQAQALLDWQIATNRQESEQRLTEGLQTLRQTWGNQFDGNRSTALKAFIALDKRLGGELAKSFSGQQMANDPVMIRAFYELGKLISEDTLSGGKGGIGDRETPEQTYQNMFK